MTDEERTTRAEGLTPSERHLSNLCEQTFLSLWSYPTLYRNQLYGTIGKQRSREGKEVCDLIVVFENRIILFSDKHCAFPHTGNLDLDWSRWFRKAVLQSAMQLWGAERWIRQYPERLFLDRACTQRLPLALHPSSDLRVHRIVVAHEVVGRCKTYAGGSGSLAIRPSIVGDQHLLARDEGGTPFSVGVLDAGKGFVHVLDDLSLDVLLTTLDTVSDFISYLESKELLIARERLKHAAGEEDLLALYLTRTDGAGKHTFPSAPAPLVVEPGQWARFRQSPQRLAQIQANRVSYAWDSLIETFCKNLLAGTQAFASVPGVANQEVALRLLAREHRTRRRMLGNALIELIERTGRNKRATRTVVPTAPGEPHYVFLLLPRPQHVSDEQYREVRRMLLPKYCAVTKLLFPDAADIVGIATETRFDELHSEDFAYLDARVWSVELNEHARATERELQDSGLLNERTMTKRTELEYPTVQRPLSAPQIRFAGVGRNDRCPCNSGKKFKRCHGR